MNRGAIINHIRKCITTGIIDDALVEYYDQHGKWRGDTIAWQSPVPHALLDGMRHSFLPASRRRSCGRLGHVLRTSLVLEGDERAYIKHAEIRGSLIVKGNAVIHAPSLRRIGGHLVSDTTKKIDMPWLSAVGGRVELLQTFLQSAPRLRHVGGDLLIAGELPPMVETVGGRLGVYWAFSFGADRLRRVGGWLVLSKADDIRVPALESVGGGFLLSHLARRIIAPQLQSVGGDFLAGSVVEIHAPRLRAVKGDLDTGSAEGFYDPSVQVEGDWTVFPGTIRKWELRDAARVAIRGKPFEL